MVIPLSKTLMSSSHLVGQTFQRRRDQEEYRRRRQSLVPLTLERPAANYEVLFCRLPGFKKERYLVEFDILIPL